MNNYRDVLAHPVQYLPHKTSIGKTTSNPILGQFGFTLEIETINCYVKIMAKDKFKIKLECPKCGAKNEANAEEEDGWSYAKGNKETSIVYLPQGFEIVSQKSNMASVDIYCNTCGVSAVI